jgi:hypothetical protein
LYGAASNGSTPFHCGGSDATKAPERPDRCPHRCRDGSFRHFVAGTGDRHPIDF